MPSAAKPNSSAPRIAHSPGSGRRDGPPAIGVQSIRDSPASTVLPVLCSLACVPSSLRRATFPDAVRGMASTSYTAEGTL
ncbi:hypothetical protein SAXI111661_02770 [Saccharomonospora xinjiangensis]